MQLRVHGATSTANGRAEHHLVEKVSKQWKHPTNPVSIQFMNLKCAYCISTFWQAQSRVLPALQQFVEAVCGSLLPTLPPPLVLAAAPAAPPREGAMASSSSMKTTWTRAPTYGSNLTAHLVVGTAFRIVVKQL